jgi:MoxR-like ATPase
VTPEVEALRAELEAEGYVADPSIAMAVFLARELKRPLLVEGDAGVGKTELAKTLARLYATELIRLQCYEGLDVQNALYEWDYPRQMLRLRIAEAKSDEGHGLEHIEQRLFSRDCLLERPLLRAITRTGGPAVLLVDEVDRADDAFEAFLLELLSDFQVTIPELGTLRAEHRPHVVLTSNHTRDLGDALRRRCLYLYIQHPSLEKEIEIVRMRCPQSSARLSGQIARVVQGLRRMPLAKPPGVAETIDFAQALVSLRSESVDADVLGQTLGCLLKDRRDLEAVTPSELASLVARTRQVPG